MRIGIGSFVKFMRLAVSVIFDADGRSGFATTIKRLAEGIVSLAFLQHFLGGAFTETGDL
jgi:hypothetical protein